MVDCFAADIWLAALRNVDGAHDAAFNVLEFDGVLDGHGIHDGAKHSHVIALGLLDADLVAHSATPDIAGADNDADLSACVASLFDHVSDHLEFLAIIDRMVILVLKRFAGDLQDYSFVHAFHIGLIISQKVRAREGQEHLCVFPINLGHFV